MSLAFPKHFVTVGSICRSLHSVQRTTRKCFYLVSYIAKIFNSGKVQVEFDWANLYLRRSNEIW